MLFIKELLFITFLLNVINIVTAMEIKCTYNSGSLNFNCNSTLNDEDVYFSSYPGYTSDYNNFIYGQRFSNNQFHIYVNKHGQKCECDIYNNYGDQIDFNGHNPFCC